jgi:hypothetical protein
VETRPLKYLKEHAAIRLSKGGKLNIGQFRRSPRREETKPDRLTQRSSPYTAPRDRVEKMLMQDRTQSATAHILNNR